MDSRLLYNTTKALKGKINWNISDNEEWIYIGSKNDLKTEVINNIISDHFNSQKLYLVIDRHKSGLLELHKEYFESILGIENFFIWNIELSKVIEFNKVGILRIGHVNK